MSSYATYQVNRLISDMTHIRSAIADISREEEKETARIARATLSLQTTRSVSGAASFRRDIDLSRQKLGGLINRKETRITELAQRQIDLTAAQKALAEEQQRTGKKVKEIVASLEPTIPVRSEPPTPQWARKTEKPISYPAFVSQSAEEEPPLDERQAA